MFSILVFSYAWAQAFIDDATNEAVPPGGRSHPAESQNRNKIELSPENLYN